MTSALWEDAKVIGKDEVLGSANVSGRLRIARKPRQYDEWDPYVPPYDPYGPGRQRDASRWQRGH